MNTKNQNQVEEIHHRELRWYCLSAIGMATLSRDEDDAKAVAAESDQLYPQNGPHLAVQMAPVSPDGRGTDAQIEKEREIARLAIVGAIAAGHAGRAHPGADHWLAAAHDAGLRIAELEQQARCSRSACLSQSAESDQQQALSITSAQPAEVSDAEIIAIKKATKAADLTQPWGDTLAFARAILALRPHVIATAAEQAEPRAYLICGGRLYKDQAVMGLPQAEDRVATRGDGSRIEPLYTRALRPQAVPMTPEPKAAPKLIGWRTSDYLMETADKSKADNWSVHHEMLPIFEGDPHTKLGSHGITAQGAQEGK